MIAAYVSQNSYEIPDIIVPIPLHTARMGARGYNQSAEIATSLSKIMNIPVDQKILNRVKYTVKQADLNENQRVLNLNNAFTANPCRHKHIALVDDVVTSGSTVNSAARALLNAGVGKISVWAIAKT